MLRLLAPDYLVLLLLVALYPFPVSPQPVALPLPVTVVEVEFPPNGEDYLGCTRVMQSTLSCPIAEEPDPERGFIVGTAILSNPAGKVELNISGSASAIVNLSPPEARARVLLEIVVPPDAVAVAMEISHSTPRPAGTERMSSGASTSAPPPQGNSAIFGDSFNIDEASVSISDPPGNGWRVAVVRDLIPGDTVQLPMSTIISLRLPDGNASTFDETSVWEFSYVPAPEPSAQSGLGAGIVGLMALAAWRRR